MFDVLLCCFVFCDAYFYYCSSLDVDLACDYTGSTDFYERAKSCNKKLKVYKGMRHSMKFEPGGDQVKKDTIKWFKSFLWTTSLYDITNHSCCLLSWFSKNGNHGFSHALSFQSLVHDLTTSNQSSTLVKNDVAKK